MKSNMPYVQPSASSSFGERVTPLLTVGVSCLAERVPKLVLPDLGSDVEVIVCVQGDHSPHPPSGAVMVEVGGRGVARSRNAAIEAATGQYLLFADDDVAIDSNGVWAGVRHLQRTKHAVVLGQALTPSGLLRKRYPQRPAALTRFNTGKAATYEIIIDLSQVRAAGVRFDERFGAGASLHLADEYIFLVDLLRAGLKGEAIPQVFGTHPDVSSGHRWDRHQDAHVRAVALNHVFGCAAPLARTAFAIKHRRNLGGTQRVVKFIFDSTKPPLD
jgi:hypothetical protein